MSKTLNIILILAVVVMGVFLYKNWGLGEKLFNAQEKVALITKQYGNLQQEHTFTTEEYNKAQVTINKQKLEIQKLDKDLKVSRKEQRKLQSVVSSLIEGQSSGRGEIRVVTQVVNGVEVENFEYKDYRLAATVDPTNRTLDYGLDQTFAMNLYVIDEITYKAEMVELNDKGEIVTTYKFRDFTVEKKRSDSSWHTGFNMSVGGGVGIDTSLGFAPHGYLSFNFLSKGATHLDSDLRIITPYVGTNSIGITPVSWRISNIIPFFSDIYLDIPIGWKYGKEKTFTFGIGLSSTL